ncbi:serine hydrolase domain-containing protein [Granulosicoccus antarcticus]|uniref:6-aminohexanoate-dimer hydrolase n=1 Tax=Granulosicoccus antarcticus IMCC3135 TaxID=1192854 RepID=A0A2Z2NZ59_9GAMM|nr:serine hydrolase [Granulosicoccus antarcticus]ASJ75715.1 6-aminohexanoate-dimer hydrolase [Granulosicoccus antarcticus IMCC3135]
MLNKNSSANEYRHAAEAIGGVEDVYDGHLTPDMAVSTFRNIDRLFPTRIIVKGKSRHMPEALVDLPGRVRLNEEKESYDLYDFLALDNVTGLIVLKDGKIAYETYQRGNGPDTRWMSMSVAKSVTSTLIGAAVNDGLISLDDQVVDYVPALLGSAYDGVSVHDVLIMSSGVTWDETYTNPESDRRDLLRAQIAQQRDAAMKVMGALPRAGAPGSIHNYSTGETQVLAEIVYGAIKRPLAEYLSEKIWGPYGMQADAHWWLDSPDGLEIGGSGLSATLRDFALFGQFFLEGGKGVLPDGWTSEAGARRKLPDGSELDYGYMWWPGSTKDSIADGAFAARGIHGQHIYINPAKNIVIATHMSQPKPLDKAPIDPLAFFDAISEALE